MTGKPRHGWAVFCGDVDPLPRRRVHRHVGGAARQSDSSARSASRAADGNMEGKEVRFGIGDSALFATDHDRRVVRRGERDARLLHAARRLVPLLNIMLGEVIFGGVGAGLYGMFLFIVLAVFIAGLMVGRTPEYLGKKIEAHDVKLAMLAVLILAFSILVGTAVAAVTGRGHVEPQQRRPARPQRDDVRVHQRHRQQRQRVRRPQREHEVLQRRPRRWRCSSAAS